MVLAALAGWLVFGSYRLMCDELKVRTRPWALGGFIGFVAVLYAGWLYGPNTTPLAWVTQICTLGLCGALLAAYVCAMAFATDPLMPRRLLGYAARGLWRRVAEEAPLWTVAAAYALPLAVLAGRIGAALIAALGREAAIALEVELHAFAAAELADGVSKSCHGSLLSFQISGLNMLRG